MILTIDHLNLNQTAKSGQCFRWHKTDENSYLIPPVRINGNLSNPLTISNIGNSKFDLSCSQKEWDNIWSLYFDMDTDYSAVEDKIMSSGDSHCIEAFQKGYGIRILRQDLWEIIISFLISQNNNITRISRSIEAICQKAGLENNAFPYPGEIDISMFDDSSLGLGYRNTYLKKIYEYALLHPEFPDELKSLSYEKAYTTLLTFTGIGPKVANCICLFGLHHIDAFPIDTHVKQLLNTYYINGFPFDYYEGIAGIIQQYLFYYELNH